MCVCVFRKSACMRKRESKRKKDSERIRVCVCVCVFVFVCERVRVRVRERNEVNETGSPISKRPLSLHRYEWDTPLYSSFEIWNFDSKQFSCGYSLVGAGNLRDKNLYLAKLIQSWTKMIHLAKTLFLVFLSLKIWNKILHKKCSGTFKHICF